MTRSTDVPASKPAGQGTSGIASDKIGAYFLANDVIYDWAVAFLESFRHFNPDLRLIMIPFDERTDRLRKLLPQYNVEVLDSPAFAELDELGHRISRGEISYAYRWFRKFAAFWGPLDEFFYLDGRILILSDLRPLVEVRRGSGYDLLHYDCVMDAVYHAGPFRKQMLREKRARGFVATLFSARRDLFSLEEIARYVEEAQPVRDQLHTGNADQSFLNYMCDMKGVPYGAFYDVIDDLVSDCWAWYGGVYRGANNRYYRWQHGGIQHNKRVPLIHWAGIRRNPLMPQAGLWLKFRMKSEPMLTRMARKLQWRLAYFPLKLIDIFRRNRHVSNAYHLLRRRVSGKPLPERLAPTLGISES